MHFLPFGSAAQYGPRCALSCLGIDEAQYWCHDRLVMVRAAIDVAAQAPAYMDYVPK